MHDGKLIDEHCASARGAPDESKLLVFGDAVGNQHGLIELQGIAWFPLVAYLERLAESFAIINGQDLSAGSRAVGCLRCDCVVEAGEDCCVPDALVSIGRRAETSSEAAALVTGDGLSSYQRPEWRA